MAAEPRALQRDDLLRAANSAGFSVSGRLLEEFRQDGLVPRPARVSNDGRRPVWIYPDGSDRQLVRLLCWRKHTKDVDVLRVLLWMECFPVALDVVRASVTAVLDGLLRAVERDLRAEASRQGLDAVAEQDAVVSSIAATVAAKRCKNALPRPIRVPADQRATAVAHLLQIFALGEEPEVTEEEAETIEKVLGVSPGRRQRVEDAGPWLTGAASALVGATDFLSLPRMAEAIADATDSEWAAARPVAAALFLQLPVVARALAATYGKDNFAGMGGLTALDGEPLMGVVLVAFALGARRSDWFGNVEALHYSLAPWPTLVGGMEQVLDMSQPELDRNVAVHGAEMRDRTHRIIKALVDGDLNPGPKPTQ
ncbi:hypothetical protein ABZ498_28390 [Streptomyces lavendulocolor]|uniref:hypothetical protein n=1 Tax=Streptomyces lavendulocolor TaxID=67316 RepID=UPI0033E2B6E6